MHRLPWWLPVLGLLAGCEPFTPWFDYAADDPRLQLIGRMDMTTEDGPTYAFPGGTIRFRCDCTGVDVDFKDLGTDFGIGGDEHTNYVNVIVDGKEAAKVQLQPEANILRGARNLSKGEHTIEIVKRTEGYAGAIQFLGISLQGILLDPPPVANLHMEFIGDSITCGYGNEVRIYAPNYTEPNTGYHSVNEDISKSFGPLVAREFNADALITCISGTGVYRNLNGSTDGAFPALYPRLNPNQETPLWDTSRYTPDVIVINLGNNDFNVLDDTQTPSAPPADPFKQAYKRFVTQLRSYYPQAKIICTIGPLMNDNYPPGRKHWTLIQQYVSDMVKDINTYDPEVYYYPYEPILSDPYGEDWHPTAEGHAQMAQELIDYLHTLGL